MGDSTLERISKSGMRGWMRGEVLKDLPSNFFEDPLSSFQEMGGKVLKESRWRAAVLLRLPTGKGFFLKRDKTKGWAEGLKFFFSHSRARREFLVASQLEGKGLALPRPLSWIERVRNGWVRESYYLSEAIGEGVSFIEDGVKSKEPRSITQLAMTLRKFQEAGLFHRDLHGGNFLWEGDTLFLTDLHGAKMVKRLSLDQRLWNLSHLFHSLRSMWREEEQLRFLDRYFEGKFDPLDEKEILREKIHAMMDRLQRRQWRSRTKRCLKESTEFGVQREKGVRYFHRRDFPVGRLKRVMAEHQNLVREQRSSLIKDSPEVIVSILKDGGERVCVKQFSSPSFWRWVKEHFRRSKGLKSWRAANGMRARGVPSLRVLALAKRKGWLGPRDSFLFMEVLEGAQEMDRYLLRGFQGFDKKRLFIMAFARWLVRLHQTHLYHRDMKTCNILVSEEGETWNFLLLDFEDILLDEDVSRKKLYRNFLQLNTSTPRVMTKVDRYRFFKEYSRLHPVVKDRKVFLRGLIDESRRRGLVYVSPQGVVTEAMG